MATILSIDGAWITGGLQGCTVCDEAIQAARRTAARTGESVLLEDDDGWWVVAPDGSTEAADMGELGYADDDDGDALGAL